jgi:uncharacterized phage-associated protein
VTSALDVGKYFLANQSRQSGELLTNMKLQKLVYYAQGFYLAIHGQTLFSEPIKAWERGPVVPDLWHEYKKYGSSPLPIPRSVAYFDDPTRDLLSEVSAVYGQFSAWRLRELSHQEPPWIEAYNSSSRVIQTERMRSYFTTRLT